MIYAIGDIHGQLTQLHRALALVEADGGPDAQIIFVGDYTDRGPDSRGVVELLKNGVEAGRNWVCLKGNHDRMFEWFVRTEPKFDLHLPVELPWTHERLGGLTTLASYGVDVEGNPRLSAIHAQALQNVPQDHLDFLRSRPLVHETEELFFVHAGIRPGIALADQAEHDMLWIRQGFIDDDRPHPKMIVHGHTALKHPKHEGNRINLDGGAGYGNDLWPVRFSGTACDVLTANGLAPLTPA